MSNPIQDMPHDDSSFVTWKNEVELNNVLMATANNIGEYGCAGHSEANVYGRTFINTETGISVRGEYNNSDYEYYRPGERNWQNAEDAIALSMRAYERVSIVRSVIDMMGDFTVQGIRIVHPNKRIEEFYRNWAKAVDFYSVSERIANMLYRTANCPVKIRYGTINTSIEKNWKNTKAADEIKIYKEKHKKRRIPLNYSILNPLSIDVIGGDLASFVGQPIYALKISHTIRMMMQRVEKMAMTNERLNDMIQFIPDDLKVAIKGGKSVMPLDQEKISMLYYKKDDWNTRAMPMLASIMENLMMLEKMHLADKSALDGAIAQIRLWRIGSLEHKMLPKRPAINKLRNELAKVGTGVLDIVWGPEVDFKESNSQVHNYLKSEKYQQVMTEIYAGLGVPATLTGSSSSNQGFTNNAISMKTLIERLEYGRKILVGFWEEQFKRIQKSMGWQHPAKVMFDYRVLGDDAAEKKLLLDMWDRRILANESMQELCRRDPDLERIRINREQRSENKGQIPHKAGPYHNSQPEHELRKIVLQGGSVTPSEVGLELNERKEGEKTRNEQSGDLQIKLRDQKVDNDTGGQPGEGRPKNSKDTQPRKQKQVNPRTMGDSVALLMWSESIQNNIASLIHNGILATFNKKNFRSLTKEELASAEEVKFRTLSCISPYEDFSDKLVYNILNNNYNFVQSRYDEMKILHAGIVEVFEKNNNRQPTVDENRRMQAAAYSIYHES